jgi:hypothetical protein
VAPSDPSATAAFPSTMGKVTFINIRMEYLRKDGANLQPR